MLSLIILYLLKIEYILKKISEISNFKFLFKFDKITNDKLHITSVLTLFYKHSLSEFPMLSYCIHQNS